MLWLATVDSGRIATLVKSESFCPDLPFLYFCLQITELLDDDKCEAECEELPQDGEEGPSTSDSPQHTCTDDSPTAR